MPPLALYFGMGAAPLFGGAWYGRLRRGPRAVAGFAIAVVLLGTSVAGFADSGVIQHLYRPDNLNLALVDAGWAIDKTTPKESLVVTVEYERHGANSPMLLYFSQRRGWSFDATSITPAVIEYLAGKHHACHVAVADWPALEVLRPDMITWLAAARPIELPYTHPRFRLFALPCAAAIPGPLAVDPT
jgi:hypothetical protein